MAVSDIKAKHDPLPLCLLMAGGSGFRFWPLSQKGFPKQFLKLFGQRSLIEETIFRLTPWVALNRIFISTLESQAPLVREACPQITQLILEPSSRNTAPSLCILFIEIRSNLYPKRAYLIPNR